MQIIELSTPCAQIASHQALARQSSININIGDEVRFDMYVDAADVGGISKGGLDVFYDISKLKYNPKFSFDPPFQTNTAPTLLVERMDKKPVA
jgi:hypothetical protein